MLYGCGGHFFVLCLNASSTLSLVGFQIQYDVAVHSCSAGTNSIKVDLRVDLKQATSRASSRAMQATPRNHLKEPRVAAKSTKVHSCTRTLLLAPSSGSELPRRESFLASLSSHRQVPSPPDDDAPLHAHPCQKEGDRRDRWRARRKFLPTPAAMASPFLT
jgi:hypothetical protein